MAAIALPLVSCAVSDKVYWALSGNCRPLASLPFQVKLLTPELRLVSGPDQTACPAAFEIVDFLGDAPDIHCLPVGNAGNITAYWKGFTEYAADGVSSRRPREWGFQAAGSAPIVNGAPVMHPSTIATAIRIGNPASWDYAIAARDESGGLIEAVTDREILASYRLLASREGVFVEPASAASVAGLLKSHAAGLLDPGQRVVCTVTGHGLKDPEWAIAGAPKPTSVAVDAHSAAVELGLA